MFNWNYLWINYDHFPTCSDDGFKFLCLLFDRECLNELFESFCQTMRIIFLYRMANIHENAKFKFTLHMGDC